MSITRRTRPIEKGKHNWLEDEYILAIYMGLYSRDEHKVGIYNHYQCANIIGIKANSMKMMADNFSAYVGGANLGTDCRKMTDAFTKYKDFPEEKLRKLAVGYIEKTWNYQVRQVNVKRHIQSIGSAAFVDCYEIFETATKDLDHLEKYIDKLPHKWSKKSRELRMSHAVMLFKCICEKDALEMIIKSRVKYETVRKAKELLNKLL